MGVVKKIKDLFGITPINIGSLNEEVTGASVEKLPEKPLKPQFESQDPLDGIEITDEYIKIKELIEAGCPVVFITGNAGTGKSTLIHYLQEILNKQTVVVAPTGVAALQAKGVTIH